MEESPLLPYPAVSELGFLVGPGISPDSAAIAAEQAATAARTVG